MIADDYLRLRTELENALASRLQIAFELERDPVMLETIQGLIRDAREPFLFVVVGEVKAGKSSLLNALFGQEFCPIDLFAGDRPRLHFQIRHGRTIRRCLASNNRAFAQLMRQITMG